MKWQYFATSHGKGVVDGIGGSAKSLVRQKVMSKGNNAEIVQNSADFFRVASGLLKDVTVLHIPESEVKNYIERSDPWNEVQDVPGISKMHSAVTKDGCTINLYHTCADAEAFRLVHYERGGDKGGLGAVGEWVVVQYQGLF